MRRDLLPVTQLPAWCLLNGPSLVNAAVVDDMKSNGGASKGAGLVALRAALGDGTHNSVLMTVPSDLILSKERVEQMAKYDTHLREVLHAVETFAEKPRLAILIFLLIQISHSSPDLAKDRVGVTSPFTDYVKFLPDRYSLSTFYSERELELLSGTSLQEATMQKLASLEREFDTLRELTQDVVWCQKHWWNDDTGRLCLGDWKLVDAMYRSRALDLPEVGDSMVPVIDMANHSSDDSFNARFEMDASGSALLLLRDGKNIREGEEITIQYGHGGACEMMFSYGFLEPAASSAREVLLNLAIPDDDPLKVAKKMVAQHAPGLRLYVSNAGQVCWESKYLWWICVNEEDGLDFKVSQTIDGDRQLQPLWKNAELDPNKLEEVLLSDHLRDMFRLRAVITIQQRLEQQGRNLVQTAHLLLQPESHDGGSTEPYEAIQKLRTLEEELLSDAFNELEEQKIQLLATPVVQQYLAEAGAVDADDGPTEDFA